MKWDELPGASKWDRKLAYFLNPENQREISKRRPSGCARDPYGKIL